MKSFNYKFVTMILGTSLLMACTKETVRVEESILPPEKIEASAVVKKNTIKFSKSSLGKLFILMPIATFAGRSASPNYLRSILVTFERSGDRIGIYNRTTENLYSEITADALIQTFKIVSENEEQVEFNIGQGFLNLDMKNGIDMLNPSFYAIDSQLMESKAETALKVKDSFIKSLALQNNAIQIVQDIRMTLPFTPQVNLDPKLKEKMDQYGALPREVEQGANLSIEIKPYQRNEAFQTKLYDTQERFGYFVNKFANKDSERQTLEGQIARWDIAESRGPIRVLVEKSFPEMQKESVITAVRYWNKIFGRELMQIEFDVQLETFQPDRSIVIRWIKWDQGNGAYANIQGDPLTGESLRGFVYFTSAFVADKNFDGNKPKSDAAAHSANGLCRLEVDAASIHKVNIVNQVLAHELGHVMGLRHNFAGSSNAPASDEQINKAIDQALTDGTVLPTAMSSTVMDYLPEVGYSILGGYLKDHVLPYDSMAIGWGYLGQEPARTANMYCSDEHIASVQDLDRKFLGCARMDLYQNVFFAEKVKNLQLAKNAVHFAIEIIKLNIEPVKSLGPSYAKYFLNFSPELSLVKDMYESTPVKIQPFVVVDDIVPGYLQYLNPYFVPQEKSFYNTYNAPGDMKISKDLEIFGGLKGFLNAMNPITAFGENFFQKQVQSEGTLKKLVEIGLSQEQAIDIQKVWLETAKELDSGKAAADINKLVDFSKLRNPDWKK